MAAKAATLAGSKGTRRFSAPVVAKLPPPAVAQPVVAVAPQLVFLTGIVLNPKGQPCPGVCVFPTTNTHQIAVTDAQGAFQLQVPAQASLRIQADYAGLGSSQVAINSYMPQPLRIVLGR